jgi:hypothetical protein
MPRSLGRDTTDQLAAGGVDIFAARFPGNGQ